MICELPSTTRRTLQPFLPIIVSVTFQILPLHRLLTKPKPIAASRQAVHLPSVSTSIEDPNSFPSSRLDPRSWGSALVRLERRNNSLAPGIDVSCVLILLGVRFGWFHVGLFGDWSCGSLVDDVRSSTSRSC
ncbi:hypothetical protein Droror1_Dr00021011 [Drosera rotundifolia]